jgi:hypothetical protein
MIFVKTVENFSKDDNYLVWTIHFLELGVLAFVKENPFGSIKHISMNDPQYKTLFQSCSSKCDFSHCTIVRWKWKIKCRQFFNCITILSSCMEIVFKICNIPSYYIKYWYDPTN